MFSTRAAVNPCTIIPMDILERLRTIFRTHAQPVTEPFVEPMKETTIPWTQQERIDARHCNSIDALSVYLRHYNGYVREAALQRAAELASPLLLPAIVERLNDWVPQVRSQAREALRALLPSLDADAILGVLPDMQDLSRAGRTDHASWIAEFEQASIRLLGVPRILDGLRSRHARIARACYRLLDRYDLADVETLIRQVLPHSADIVISRTAAEAIASMPGAMQPALYRLALDSGFGVVRIIALRAVLREESVENDALATGMLVDSQAWVRQIAAAYLSKRGIDCGALYAGMLRDAQSGAPVLRAALSGIAGLGDRRFLDCIHTFTTDASGRVRVAAFLAWLHLDPGRKDDIAAEAIASPHRRVRRLALAITCRHGAYLPLDAALPVLEKYGDIDLMLSFASTEPWTWLETIVRLEPRSRENALLRQQLAGELAHWLNTPSRNYLKPSGAQRALFSRPDTVDALRALTGAPGYRREADLAFTLSRM